MKTLLYSLAAFGALSLVLDVAGILVLWFTMRGFKHDEELAKALEDGRKDEKKPFAA